MITADKTIKVLIVDGLLMVCENLETLFSKFIQKNIEVVGFAHNGKNAILEVIKNEPDIVIIDLIMPVMGGIDAIKEIIRRFPKIKVIAFSTFNDDFLIKSAILAGAKGYILKDSKLDELELAIKAVCNDSFYLDSSVATFILSENNISDQSTKDTTQTYKSNNQTYNIKQFSTQQKKN